MSTKCAMLASRRPRPLNVNGIASCAPLLSNIAIRAQQTVEEVEKSMARY